MKDKQGELCQSISPYGLYRYDLKSNQIIREIDFVERENKVVVVSIKDVNRKELLDLFKYDLTECIDDAAADILGYKTTVALTIITALTVHISWYAFLGCLAFFVIYFLGNLIFLANSLHLERSIRRLCYRTSFFKNLEEDIGKNKYLVFGGYVIYNIDLEKFYWISSFDYDNLIEKKVWK